ncbi:MAG: hypothetical protein ACQESR_20580 [Planctomycetota bacterium]
MESCPTQAVLPLVGLATHQVMRDRYNRPPGGPRLILDKPSDGKPGKPEGAGKM